MPIPRRTSGRGSAKFNCRITLFFVPYDVECHLPMGHACDGAPKVLRSLSKVVLLFLAAPLLIWQPLRLSSPIASELLGWSVALVSPWLANLTLYRLGQKWAQILSLLLCIPLAAQSWILGFLLITTVSLDTGRNAMFDPIAESEWKGSVVRLYRTNFGGATTAFGVVIRQERAIIPGVLLVRPLNDFYRCYALDLTSTEEGVRVEDKHSNCTSFGKQKRDYRLKRFVYF